MVLNKRQKFNQICKDIKSIKIQGARNIAKAAFNAYTLVPNKNSKQKLLSLRPTEPMLINILNNVDKLDLTEINNHLKLSQDKINQEVFKLIKNNFVVFTHCHSSAVVNALIYAKKKGKKFEVYNTETRPLYQGRKTAKELKKAKIKVTMFVDSAVGVALSKEQGTKKVSKIFLGADAITEQGIINKIGSETIAILAKKQKIPVYIIADSWKFTKKKIPLENRKLNEIWDKAPKDMKFKNPAFEFVPKKYITKWISEKGVKGL